MSAPQADNLNYIKAIVGSGGCYVRARVKEL